MRIEKITIVYGEKSKAVWDNWKKELFVTIPKNPNYSEVIQVVAECMIGASEDEREIFIPLKVASERLGMCAPKLQQYAKSHFKGFPAVLEGNKYLVNSRMLTDWADKYTQDAINTKEHG